MTEHLPECAVAAARPGTFTSCICDALRACEVRVLNDYRKQHDGISEGYFQQIRNDALDAAREAVAAIHDDCNCYEDLGIRADAIAAIDALREKP